MTLKCDYCGSEFERSVSKSEKFGLHFCNRECMALLQQGQDKHFLRHLSALKKSRGQIKRGVSTFFSGFTLDDAVNDIKKIANQVKRAEFMEGIKNL